MPDRLVIPDHQLDKQERRVIILRQVVLTLAIVWVLASTSALLYNAWVGSKTRSTLVDCVEPRGKCSQRNQEETAKVVDGLIKANQLDEVATRRIVIISVTCQQLPGIDTLAEVQECVDRQLALDKQKKE